MRAAMQPLARIAPRLVFDSAASCSLTRAIRRPGRAALKPSIYLPCKIQRQVRAFAEYPKPPQSSPSADKEAPSHLSTPTSPHAELADEPPNSARLTEHVDRNLPSAQEGRRLAVARRFSKVMDNMQGNIFIASQRLNDLTGYSGIEVLKSRITELEKRVSDAKEAVRAARQLYKTTVSDRASTQREVTGLLARKDTWTPADLERFTALYRMDHSNEHAVQEAATKLGEAEREAEHAANTLSTSILSRYHEEQIWSDKIRQMSTWGTWGLMGVNVLLFLVFQFGFEPWRRRRLVHGFEEKVREALEKEKDAARERRALADKGEEWVDVPLDGVVSAGLQELQVEMEGGQDSQPAVEAVAACISGEQSEKAPSKQQEEAAALDSAELHIPNLPAQLYKPSTWIAGITDMFSEEPTTLRKRDITFIALEGAATGAAIVTIIATLIFRSS